MNETPPKLQEAENLKLLSMFHYIVGGIHIGVFSFITLPLVVLTPAAWQIGSAMGDHGQAHHWYLSSVLALLAGFWILVGWGFAILTIYSGVCIRKRKKRLLSLVTGGLNCVLFPFGTALGIATLVLLGSQSAKKIYAS